MNYAIMMTTKAGEQLFMIDRNIRTDKWWAPNLIDAILWTSRNEAAKVAGRLRGRISVEPLSVARLIIEKARKK